MRPGRGTRRWGRAAPCAALVVLALAVAGAPRPGRAGEDGEPGPAAALASVEREVRKEAPDAEALRNLLLWPRWGFEGGDDDLYGDLKGLFGALRAAKGPSEASLVGTIGGTEPHRHARLAVKVGERAWRVLFVEEEGWRLARVIAEEKAEPGKTPIAAAVPADVYAAAEEVLAAIDARDAKAFGARFDDLRGGAPQPADPATLDKALAALHETYGGRPRALGGGRPEPEGVVAVAVLFGEKEDGVLAWLRFATMDGRRVLVDVAEGDVTEFVPRAK